MGTPARASASPRLCRLLLPAGLVLLLLLLLLSSLSSSRLRLPPAAWLGGRAKGEEGGRQRPPWTPAAPQTPGLPPPAQRGRPPCPQDGPFRIQCLQAAFAASVAPSGEVLLGEYLRGWKELAKFIDSLGTAFGLISRETWNKISVMQGHHAGPHGAHYRTLQAMVTFELAQGLVDFRSLPASRPPSGCRTLLRLHRALRWLELFLFRLGTSEAGHPAQLCAGAYQEALAPYHGWLVRQAAALAFMALPSRQELRRALCLAEEPGPCATLLATVRAIGHVYNATQELYSAHQMLRLP